MAPFLRDEGPPVSPQTIQRARESLPLEFGSQLVNEKGREVLVVRVPKAKPDYLHDLAEVAFYVSLDTIRNVKDVLLVGHEKTARLEPQLLRDHIRAQAREDAGVVDHLRRTVDKGYGFTIVQSPSNHRHQALAMRIPKDSVAEFSPDDVRILRDSLQGLKGKLDACQYAYIVAQKDFERLGRRVLLELLGMTPGTAAPSSPAVEPLPVAVPTPQAAPSPPASAPAPAAPAARPTFPATPAAGAPVAAAPAPLPTAFPSMAPPSPPPINSLVRAEAAAKAAPQPAPPTAPPAPVAPTPPPAPVAPAPSQAPEVAVHEEYEIVSKPKPAAAPAPRAAPPLRLEAAVDHDVTTHDEYEIVSKPKPATPAPAAPKAHAHRGAPALAAQPGFESAATDEYEVVTRKPAPAPAAPAPAASAAPEPERKVERMDAEFEVYTSKPKAPPAPSASHPAPSPTPAAAPAPTRTKEYEIMTRPTPPATPPGAGLASRLHLPSAEAAPVHPVGPHVPTVPPAAAPTMQAPALPRDDPRVLPTRTVFPAPSADSGAAIIPSVAPAAPELVLAQRFRESGYEVVEGLRAQGTVFAFAAHRPNGRRVLVKRAGDFGPDEAATLSQLVSALGADVCLVVPDRVLPGTRLATWGTRIEVVGAADVPGMTF